jgi:hypothetical protein
MKSKLTGSPMPTKSPGPNAAPKNSGAAGTRMDQDRRDRAEMALSTLSRAAEHQRDKQLMGDVKRVAKEKITSLSGIAGMKK